MQNLALLSIWTKDATKLIELQKLSQYDGFSLSTKDRWANLQAHSKCLHGLEKLIIQLK
jgi:hypothetical protein